MRGVGGVLVGTNFVRLRALKCLGVEILYELRLLEFQVERTLEHVNRVDEDLSRSELEHIEVFRLVRVNNWVLPRRLLLNFRSRLFE